jgi:PAS domain S-box-containing protein
MKKILVIEDNSLLLDSISDFLKEEGFDIVKAINGEEGVELAVRNVPDIILSDIYMPKMNGYEVFDALKANVTTSLIPFIFISAKAEKEDILYGLKLGADDYIIKPIDFPELLNRILTRIEKAQNTIQLSEVKYQALFETANDAILMVRLKDGVVIDANLAASRLLGYTKEELLKINGDNIFDTSDQDASLFTEPGYRYWSDFVLVDTYWKNKEGARIPIHVSGKRIQLIGENYIFLIARDITELKLKENAILASKEKAEESDRLKSSILANMSHELRTPLNGILGFAEILKEELRDPEQSSMVDNIRISGKWLMSTLDAILLLSQLEAGRISPTLNETNISDVIHSVMTSIESMANEKEIVVKNNVPDGLVISTDEKLFGQLVRQILDNAVKFTIRGEVTVDAKIEEKNGEDWVSVRVSDTGIGINPEHIEIIFHEFRQVSEGLSRKFQGSGLGLTISKKIIQLFRGEIHVESEPGKGSSFYIKFPIPQVLPLSDKKVTPKITKVVEEKVVSRDQLPLVLIVEDNLMNRELTSFFLKDICRLDHARDGRSAIRMAGEKQYAAILMDLNLGDDIDGVETAHKIREIKGYRNLPIIALTGYVLLNEEQKIMSESFSYYLTKPFDRNSIVSIMTKTLSKE